MSEDVELGLNLGCTASPAGRSVVRVDGAVDALQTMRLVRPSAVLLDLDLPAGVAWETAEALLQEKDCPPVILLTARSEQSDFRTAIRAGSLVDKTADPAKILEVVNQTLAAPDSNQAERSASQRVVIRWLRPCAWSVPLAPAYRYWGINE